MAPGRTPSATNIVALALAFHRAPVKHPDLLHGRGSLPAGVGCLLKLAGGSQPDAESAALASPDELRAAALFFVEQVLLHHDASHYRVLGVEPGAPAEQIKEHHRLLMRVFHPDRERHDDDWKDAFATRINLAYTTLHDPASRRRYDATLHGAARPGAAMPTVHRPVHLAKPPRLHGLPPGVRRHLPQWVLASTALCAVAVVGTVYVTNPRLPAGHLAQVPLPANAPLPAAAVSEATSVSVPAAAKPVVAAAVIARELPAAASVPPVARPARSPAVARPPAPAATPPARLSAERAAQPATSPQPAAAAVAAEVPIAPAAPAAPPAAPVARPAAAEPVVAAAPQPARLDPNATLERFMATYERGDTPGFMALFDEVAIGNAGGKPQIRRAHETLFRSTDLRHIDIENMAWAQQGEWLRGEGRYRTTLMRKGELQLQTESGLIRIELLRRGDQALIIALDYQPGERS